MFQFAACCLFSVSTRVVVVALLFLLNLSSRANVSERSWTLTAVDSSRRLAMEIIFFLSLQLFERPQAEMLIINRCVCVRCLCKQEERVGEKARVGGASPTHENVVVC